MECTAICKRHLEVNLPGERRRLSDIDPQAQEVLELPVLDLAAAQDEDPDLLFAKDLLREHDSRPPWDNVRE